MGFWGIRDIGEFDSFLSSGFSDRRKEILEKFLVSYSFVFVIAWICYVKLGLFVFFWVLGVRRYNKVLSRIFLVFCVFRYFLVCDLDILVFGVG